MTQREFCGAVFDKISVSIIFGVVDYTAFFVL